MSSKTEAVAGKNFDSPDEIRRPFQKGKIDVVTVGGLTFYRETLEPGWQWSKHVKPVAGGESCQRFHVKIFLAGRQRVRMEDGTEMEFGPGDVAIMQPGHDAWVGGGRAQCADRAGGGRQARRMTLSPVHVHQTEDGSSASWRRRAAGTSRGGPHRRTSVAWGTGSGLRCAPTWPTAIFRG